LPKNKAILSSPRTLEQYPEILRARAVRERETKIKPLAIISQNRALATSPRYREEHPELLLSGSPATQVAAARPSDQLQKLTRNKALAVSPRFLEEHPELLRNRPE